MRSDEGRADRAPEIAEARGEDDGWALIDEQVRQHRLEDTVGVRLAEARAETAADHDGLDVEQVDGRRDSGAEREQGALDQLVGQPVALLERLGPDAAREPRSCRDAP